MKMVRLTVENFLLDLDLGALQGLHAQLRDGEHGRGGEVTSNWESLSQMSER